MEPATSSLRLIDRIKNGDREAFSPLFEKYRPRLAVLIHYRLGPQLRQFVEVDDLLQETFLKAFNDMGRFEYRTPGSFMLWLAAIAEHVIVDLARSHGRQKRHANEIVGFRTESRPDGVELVDSKTPSRLLTEKQRVQDLLEKLDALPDEHRQVILMAKIEGLSTQEMAERLGRSRGATALLLHRAIKRFRELYNARAES